MAALKTRELQLDVDVVLADPRLPNPYHPGGEESEQDRRHVARLQEALEAVVGEGRVTYLNDHDRLVEQLQSRAADLVLNFCNAGFRNLPELQMHVPALLEVYDRPFVGADVTCLAICHDKAAVYAAAAGQGVPVPRHELLRVQGDSQDLPGDYPVLLKPNSGSGSEGISPQSLVHDADEAAARLAELAQTRVPPKWVLADGFLTGREITIAVLGSLEGGGAPICLPPLEVGYEALKDDLPRILVHESKTDEESDYWNAVDVRPAELPAELREKVERHAMAMFDRLGCRDYARFDFRCDEGDEPHLIDANAHPEWGAESLLARMAYVAGMSYEMLLDRIIASGLAGRLPRRDPGPPRIAPDSEVVVETPALRLRPTVEEDLDLVRSAESAPENRRYIEQWCEDDHRRCMAEADCAHLMIEDDDASPVGYAVLQGLSRPDRALLLRRIVVTRKGEGFGDGALSAIERYCFEMIGFNRLWLEVDGENAPARSLYERHGFETEAENAKVRMALEEAGYRRLRDRSISES